MSNINAIEIIKRSEQEFLELPLRYLHKDGSENMLSFSEKCELLEYIKEKYIND